MSPARWLLDEMVKLWDSQPERVAKALERAIESDEELRWAIVVGAYLDDQISLAKAAELLQMDRWSLQEKFRECGVPIRMGLSDIEEMDAEAQSLRR